MSEQEQAAEAAAEQDTVAPEATVEGGEQETRSEGKQFVELDDLPPVVKARFNRIYGNMKEYERVAQETAKVNRALVERLEKLETGDLQDRITTLQQRQKEAFESGDFDKAQKLNDELLDHKLAEKNRSKIEVPEIKPADDAPLTEDQLGMLAAWAQESDDDGKALRPWAKPGHKDHDRAVRYIQSAAMDPDFDVESPQGFKALLEAVDKRMGKGGQSPAPKTAAVLSGNGDGRPRSSDKAVRLTPEQIRVAENMGYTQKQYAELIQKYGVK